MSFYEIKTKKLAPIIPLILALTIIVNLIFILLGNNYPLNQLSATAFRAKDFAEFYQRKNPRVAQMLVGINSKENFFETIKFFYPHATIILPDDIYFSEQKFEDYNIHIKYDFYIPNEVYYILVHNEYDSKRSYFYMPNVYNPEFYRFSSGKVEPSYDRELMPVWLEIIINNDKQRVNFIQAVKVGHTLYFVPYQGIKEYIYCLNHAKIEIN